MDDKVELGEIVILQYVYMRNGRVQCGEDTVTPCVWIPLRYWNWWETLEIQFLLFEKK